MRNFTNSLFRDYAEKNNDVRNNEKKYKSLFVPQYKEK